MVMTEALERVLTAHDRCDRCIAQAMYMVTLQSGELYFCGHHFREYETILIDIAVDIYDSSDVIPQQIEEEQFQEEYEPLEDPLDME
jgi:hypothetical protein